MAVAAVITENEIAALEMPRNGDAYELLAYTSMNRAEQLSFGK